MNLRICTNKNCGFGLNSLQQELCIKCGSPTKVGKQTWVSDPLSEEYSERPEWSWLKK